MAQTALILGATGRFGRHAAQQFSKAGWTVRRFNRATDDLTTAAKGADIIVNAWNPPYPDWQRLLPDLHAQVITAARQTGATVIVPGNVYVFGADTLGPWSETTPHHAQNPLGRLRVELEAAYRRAGVRTIILRSGDFIDTTTSGNWFDQIMIKSLAKGVFTYPGSPDITHAWAYLPDMCRAAVQLANIRHQLPVFADIPFAGYALTGSEMAGMLEQVTGSQVRLKRMSWLPLQLARPVWRMGACLLEMRYLWDTEQQLDGTLLAKLLPGFRPTPFATALASALPQSLIAPSVQRQINPDQPVTTGS